MDNTLNQAKKISKPVAGVFLALAIVAELLSLLAIVSSHKKDLSIDKGAELFHMVMMFFLITAVLIHHHIIKENIKKIDAFDDKILMTLGIDNRWVTNSPIEDILRAFMFGLFKFLTGELTYIIIVAFEIAHIWGDTDDTIHLNFITNTFIIASFALSCLMLLWSVICAFSNPDAIKNKVTNNHLNSLPFKNPLQAFLCSDIIGFLVWLCLLMMLVLEKHGWYEPLKYIAVVYIAVVFARAFGRVSYKKGTLMPRRAVFAIISTLSFLIGIALLVFNYGPVHKKIPDNYSKNILEKVRRGGSLNVAMESNSNPMYYVDTNSRNVGFGYEFASELARRMGGGRINVIPDDFDDLPEKLRTGEADIIVAGEQKDDQMEGVRWSEPFMKVGLCYLVKDTANPTPKSLANKKIGVYKGSDVVKRWIEKHIPSATIEEEEGTGWLERYDSKGWSAVVYDDIFAYIEKSAFPGQFRQIEIPLGNDDIVLSSYCILVPNGNEAFMSELNKQIDSIKKYPSSTFDYQAALKKYFPDSKHE